MSQDQYYHTLLSINAANLTTNLENVGINRDILSRQKRHEHDNDMIISLLTKILEELRNDRSRDICGDKRTHD